jgi:putative (di)nucleoside polyphosphate hydrolase
LTQSPDLIGYRPNAGAVLFNHAGEVWIGRRADTPPPWQWQFPQGGIDPGETPDHAALRELYEETGIPADKVEPLGGIDDWLTYDFPPEVRDHHRHAKRGHVGQKQRWFAFRLLGQDTDFDLEVHGEVEFDAWRWETLAAVPPLIIPWKRHVYEVLAREFAKFAG